MERNRGKKEMILCIYMINYVLIISLVILKMLDNLTTYKCLIDFPDDLTEKSKHVLHLFEKHRIRFYLTGFIPLIFIIPNIFFFLYAFLALLIYLFFVVSILYIIYFYTILKNLKLYVKCKNKKKGVKI